MGEQKPEKTKKHICAGLLAHVETGKTLLENHLAPLETIVDISARFICNKVSYKFKHQEVLRMRDALEKNL